MRSASAVVQVVLNRLRHPAYPKTVCGVVFQGSERTTGCQFTFTCDGALARVPSADAWRRARGVADRALSGFVFGEVGTATSYHTDWVVPYWSASLDKIARVRTHLFFRWKGWWGTPAAFRGQAGGAERIDPRIVYLADPAGRPEAEDSPAAGPLSPDAPAVSPARPALQVDGVPAAALRRNVVRLMDPASAEFGLELSSAGLLADYVVAARALCRGRPSCSVVGWLSAERIPRALPVPIPALRTASFVFRRRPAPAADLILWNCRQTPRPPIGECMPGTAPAAGPAPASRDDRDRDGGGSPLGDAPGRNP